MHQQQFGQHQPGSFPSQSAAAQAGHFQEILRAQQEQIQNQQLNAILAMRHSNDSSPHPNQAGFMQQAHQQQAQGYGDMQQSAGGQHGIEQSQQLEQMFQSMPPNQVSNALLQRLLEQQQQQQQNQQGSNIGNQFHGYGQR